MSELSALFEGKKNVFVAGSSNEPRALLDELAVSKLPEGLNFIQFPLPGMNRVDFTQWHESTLMTTFFMTPDLRHADPSRLNYLPMQMRWVFDYLQQVTEVALLQVAYDREGVLRLGPNVDFADAVLSTDATIIAQLNPDITAPAGCPQISRDRIDYLFEAPHVLSEMAAPNIDEQALEIGRLVAGLINDGDCLQTGIGAIPAAILKQLQDKNDLGLHGGLIDDGGMQLIQSGNVNGLRKEIDQGLHIAGIALGSSELYEWLSSQPQVVFRGANHTHEVSAMAKLSNFVSVNSAVEIDLFGQVNAEVAGGRQISGTGGSVDFMRGAKASPGGRSIIAMNATAKGGSVSRIVPQVNMVTALRTDVDIVVTEYGIAQLKHLPNAARKKALIEIAAPQFRDELAQA